jgi:hypothetical protein
MTDTIETKAQAFERLAVTRTRKALKMISLLGNLSSAQYEATPEQIDKIEAALTAQVTATINKMRKVKTVAASFEL